MIARKSGNGGTKDCSVFRGTERLIGLVREADGAVESPECGADKSQVDEDGVLDATKAEFITLPVSLLGKSRTLLFRNRWICMYVPMRANIPKMMCRKTKICHTRSARLVSQSMIERRHLSPYLVMTVSQFSNGKHDQSPEHCCGLIVETMHICQ